MFEGKVILVTGGSSGIGACAALLFAEEGGDIAFSYKSNEAAAAEIAAKIKGLGRRVLVIQADLVNENEAKEMVARVMDEYGRIDILVNNAGGYIEGDEWNGTVEIWTRSLSQNLISTMSVSKYVLEIFQKQKSGVMVNIASRHGMTGDYFALSYAAAKAGVINITQAYAKLLEPFGRANSVSPSATHAGYWLTAPQQELEETLAARPDHKLVEPETVAKKIVFLASPEAREITGQNFPVTE
ncbi:MAG: SDR family oxidoreductase [Patescibacteria group bacterium]